ncbi:CoA transferase [Mycobacteroides abscessus]|uniref:CoA transferase n=1 Tax=Mycobacteroides abscessus TaxID=36809 RepID=UPI0009A8857C|nr:CoA transferase [Mycobacteroides abscessus]SKR49231.1 Putative L-carnitine dehydratase [Mycobacteroides abscessus subsp. abscessus]SLG04888.1 Putative L-carnitine dehydratase [Mycobacteroides abscessus subsp. abscessus]
MTSVPVQRDLTAAPDISADFNKLLEGLQLNITDTGGAVTFTGEDPILPSNHRLGAIMAMGMMAPAVATQILYRLRGGPEQDLSVDLRRAVAHINPAHSFSPTVGGYPMLPPAAAANPFGFSIYPTKDDRWYLPTAVYPKALLQWLGLLKSGFDAKSVGQAIGQWNAQDLEDVAAANGMIGAMCRTPEEWYAHPQGQYLAQTPMIEIVKIGDSDPELPSLTNPDRPLSGIKVAAMTHVIAGPVVGRVLAEQGAQVLDLSNPAVEYSALVEDCHLGARSTWSDLNQQKYRDQALRLLKGADVFVENYRGRKIANFGFSPEAVAEARPGIIYTSVRGFGWEGPWIDRGGFDMDANCVTGYTTLEGSPEKPLLPPTVILNDYLAGYLTSAGVLAALILRAKHGGSYHVRTSLSRFSMWYSELGVFNPDYVAESLKNPEHQPIPPEGLELTSAFGRHVRLEPGITYSKTPSYWEGLGGYPVVGPQGSSDPIWV